MAACTERFIYSTLTVQGYKLLHLNCTPHPKDESKKSSILFFLMYRRTLFLYIYIFDSCDKALLHCPFALANLKILTKILHLKPTFVCD